MRTLALLALFAVPLAAHADWNLRTPAGLPVFKNEIRGTFEGRKGEDTFGRLSFGLGNGLSVAATSAGRDRFSGDLAYNYLVPFPDAAPGISVGVLDVADELAGRAFYLAVTMRYGNYDPGNQDVPTELTFGFLSRDGGRGFASFALPVSEKLWFRAEYDGQNPLGAIELRPVKELAVRGMVDRNGPSLGVGVRIQF